MKEGDDILLSLKNISKVYKTGDFSQKALNDLSTEFRNNEFVAVLGPSGSGKTTLLNIIGGLDRYTNGDLIINGISTKKFKDNDWDAYRNNCIGFIFQSYNLISHISILDNVKLGMTLSGNSNKISNKKAKNALKKVGLIDHIHKKPNQLSGGQMQRVAIARALVNDPDIIMADEPTGALDSKTSTQIMDLIKEIAKDKLVIMVTHNNSLAEKYANRIIELKDGKIIKDNNPIKKSEKGKEILIKKTAMNFLTALKLSYNNIKTKKGRTLLTAFASSIGIIGIALILSLSNGFDIQISQFEKDTLANMPIMISSQAMQMDENTMEIMMNTSIDDNSYPTEKKIYPQKNIIDTMTHKNIIDQEYVDYIEKIDTELILGINYNRITNLNIITKDEKGYRPIMMSPELAFVELPFKNDEGNELEFINQYYDVIEGKLPEDKTELVLLVDNKNRIDEKILNEIGLDSTKESIDFQEILNLKFKLINNNDYYKQLGKIYTINDDFENLYKNNNAETLKIVGIIRGKEGKELETANDSGLAYTKNLMDYYISSNKNSDIVKLQNKVNYNVMTGELFRSNEDGLSTKNDVLAYLGSKSTPYLINISPKDFKTKDKIVEYLDDYNKDKESKNKIVYTDLGEMIASMSGNIMNAITYVLIGFSAISLIVSTIMIAIITYISVLERTKEIGILRAIGARKKDVTRVFNAETFIIGLCSGVLGITIARLMLLPINTILYNLTNLKNVAILNPIHAIILIIISLLLTLLGGVIPAKMASKKDPVEALRTD